MSSYKIRPPETYSDWVDILEQLKKKECDDDILSAMKSGKLQWQVSVAERFSRKFVDAINYRLNLTTKTFQKHMDVSNCIDRDLVRELMSIRKELIFLYRITALECIPDNIRNKYSEMIVESADSIQKSLEESAKSDRSGKISSIIRNHKVNYFGEEV